MNNQLQKKDSMKVPEPTLRRLPWYLSNVKLLRKKGERFVSSTQISKEINIDASQIAKDLSYVNISGRTRVGYEIDTLIAVLEDFLGFTNIHKAFLFGVGSLGGALLRDSGLNHFGLEIVAAFDVNPDLVGTTLNGRRTSEGRSSQGRRFYGECVRGCDNTDASGDRGYQAGDAGLRSNRGNDERKWTDCVWSV